MRKISILVADDSKTVRNLILNILKSSFGTENIHLAENGQEALKLFNEHNFELVISDWDMPGMSGEELLFHIRNAPKNCDVPFIMVTSHWEKDFIVTAIQNGVSQFVVKPFTPEELEEKVLLCLNTTLRRNSRRFCNLPKHDVIVTFSGQPDIHARIIDISQFGALVEIEHQDFINLFKVCSIIIIMKLPDISAKIVIDPIKAMVVRLESAETFHPTSKKCNMALYFSAIHTDKLAQGKLNQVLNWLHSRLPEAVHDLAVPMESESE